jgi:hypothetical protein
VSDSLLIEEVYSGEEEKDIKKIRANIHIHILITVRMIRAI